MLFCLFLALTAIARTSELLAWDRTISYAAQSVRSPALDRLAAALTVLGDSLPLGAACLIGVGSLFRAGRPRAAGLTMLCMLGLPLNVLIKGWIARPRPAGDLRILTAVTGLSFPSGHAMGTAIVFGFLAFQAWTHLSTPRLRLALTGTLAAVPLLVGWTRIYLGAHWFSDVVAGWTVGAFFVLFLAECYKAVAPADLGR